MVSAFYYLSPWCSFNLEPFSECSGGNESIFFFFFENKTKPNKNCGLAELTPSKRKLALQFSFYTTQNNHYDNINI